MRCSAHVYASDTGFFPRGRDDGNANYTVASIQCGVREYAYIYLRSFTLRSVLIRQHAYEYS